MHTGTSTYDEFLADRGDLASILLDAAQVMVDLEAPTRADELRQVRAQLLDQRFRILVMGEMKRGKSTLINAMLGDSLLPAWSGTSCTAVPIVVKYSDRKYAVCHRDPPEPPVEFNLGENRGGFWHAVTVSDDQRRSQNLEGQSPAHPYTHAEVFWPIDLCRKAVEIEDSPGLNEWAKEGEQRAAIAWERARLADAVLLVWSAGSIGTATETADLTALLSLGLNPRAVFMVLNNAQDIRNDAEAVERVRAAAGKIVAPLGVLDEHTCFTVASDALKGRLESSPALLAASGIVELEGKLQTFLVEQRSAIKILRPLDVAQRRVDEALVDVQFKENGASSELLRPVETARDRAGSGCRRAREIERRLARDAKRSGERLSEAVAVLVRELGARLHAGIPGVLADVEVSLGEGITGSANAKERLAEKAQSWASEVITAWEQEDLAALLREHWAAFGDLASDAASQVQGIADEVAEAKESLDRGPGGPSGALTKGTDGDPKRAARIVDAGATIDALVEQAVSAVSPASSVGGAAAFGGIAGAWLALVMSLPMLPFVVGGAIILALIGASSAADRLRTKVGEAIQAALRDQIASLEQQVVDRAGTKFAAFATDVSSMLRGLIDGIARDRELIEAEHARRSQAAAALRERCAAMRSRLRQNADRLSELRRKIEPSHEALRVATRVEEGVRDAVSDVHLAVAELASAAETPPASSILIELKERLSESVYRRLQRCVDLYKREGVWKPGMDETLARLWLRLDRAKLGSGFEKCLVYMGVTALAVSEGETGAPLAAEVKRRWTDPGYRKLLSAWYAVATDNHTITDFDDDPEGQLGKGGDRFARKYGRCLDDLVDHGARGDYRDNQG